MSAQANHINVWTVDVAEKMMLLDLRWKQKPKGKKEKKEKKEKNEKNEKKWTWKIIYSSGRAVLVTKYGEENMDVSCFYFVFYF